MELIKYGNVGIGTDEPEHELDINGRLQVRGTDFYLGQGKRALVRSNEKLIINYNDYSSSSPDYSDGVVIHGKVQIPNNVGIGTTPSSTFNLYIKGNGLLLEKNSNKLRLMPDNGGVEIGSSTGVITFCYSNPVSYNKIITGAIVANGNNSGSWTNPIIQAVKSTSSDNAGLGIKSATQNWVLASISSSSGSSNGFWIKNQAKNRIDFVINNETGNIGIGTSSPQYKLEVNGKIKTKSLLIEEGSKNVEFKYDGSHLILESNDGWMINYYSKKETYFGGRININGAAMIYNNGKIWAKEIKVRTWNPYADYVFKPDYNLPTIEETEEYIKTHKHLKEIPTEKEVVENDGMELGKMNVLLLKKVEELTLYIIDLNNKLKEQQKQIYELNKINKNEE